MPVFKVTLDVEKDGVRLPGFPRIRRLSTAENQQFEYDKAADNNATTFTTLPIDLATVNALFVTSDLPITLRLDAQSDAGIELSANGVLLIFDAVINSAAATNAKVNNPHASSAAKVTGFIAGT